MRVPSCRVRWFLWALVARIGCSWRERWRSEGAGWVDQYVLLREAIEVCVVLDGWVGASHEEDCVAARVSDSARRVIVWIYEGVRCSVEFLGSW